MEHPLDESAWKRGWQDTKTAWKSLPFILLDAVGCVVVGAVFGWGWGLGLFLFAMLCVWIGATARAPVEQRNEARTLLQKRKVPIPLRNRDELIRAIAEIQQAATNFVHRKESLNGMKEQSPLIVNTARLAFNKAYYRYWNAIEKLEQEKLVAGDAFELPILRLIQHIMAGVFLKMEKVIPPGEDKPLVLTAEFFSAEVAEKVAEVIREIDEISGQVPRKEGSQI